MWGHPVPSGRHVEDRLLFPGWEESQMRLSIKMSKRGQSDTVVWLGGGSGSRTTSASWSGCCAARAETTDSCE